LIVDSNLSSLFRFSSNPINRPSSFRMSMLKLSSATSRTASLSHFLSSELWNEYVSEVRFYCMYCMLWDNWAGQVLRPYIFWAKVGNQYNKAILLEQLVKQAKVSSIIKEVITSERVLQLSIDAKDGFLALRVLI
jgi:hypothetical protein